jgi:hypothetical protein
MFNLIMLKVDFCVVVFGGLVVSNQALINALWFSMPLQSHSLLDALLSVGISVPCGRPRFGTMGPECKLAPNTLIASLVCDFREHERWQK